MKKTKSGLINPIDALTKSSLGFFANEAITNAEETDDVIEEVVFVSTDLDSDASFYQAQIYASINDSLQLSEETDKEQRQGFCIADYNFMIRFEDGNQIMDIPDVYPVPNAPPWFLGVSNVHGRTIPVFDLKNYFNVDRQVINKNQVLNKKQTAQSMLFIIGHGVDVAGLVIEGIPQRLDIAETDRVLDYSITTELQSYINEVYSLENKVWYDLDCLNFLDAIETQLKVTTLNHLVNKNLQQIDDLQR